MGKLQKFLLIALALIFLVPFCWAYPGSNENMKVYADVLGDYMKIDVPCDVYLGPVMRGAATQPVAINITNQGSVDVRVYPRLKQEDDSHKVFENIYFSTSDDQNTFHRIGDFSVIVPSPREFSGERGMTIYLKMDLGGYDGEIPRGFNRLNASLQFVFTAS